MTFVIYNKRFERVVSDNFLTLAKAEKSLAGRVKDGAIADDLEIIRSSDRPELTKKETERVLLDRIDQLIHHLKTSHGCHHSAVDMLRERSRVDASEGVKA